MNIPRQFYGINYLSRLFSNFQDSELSQHEKMNYSIIEDLDEIKLSCKSTRELGLSAKAVSKLLYQLTTKKPCALDGIGIAVGENILFAGYRPPYSEEQPHITNSTCKTVTAIAIMFAVSEGLLKEDDLVLSFFPEYETLLTPKYVKMLTISHLLTMTSTSKCNEIVTVTEQNWVKAFLLSDCEYEPGTHFIYNSMNSYMLSAILKKVTGLGIMEYLKPRFFKELGINHIKWELCPLGIERGGWGLHISISDMLKIGMFLMENGAFAGKQLIKPEYIKKMKEVNVSQDADSLATGYGYQLWHLPNNLYMLSGMYGQHVIVDEKQKLVIATNAHSDKMFPESLLVRTILSFINSKNTFKLQSVLEEQFAYKRLLQEFEAFTKGNTMSLSDRKIPYAFNEKKWEKQTQKDIETLQTVLVNFDKKRLHINQATFKLFPYMLQGMYQCPPFLVSDISFHVTKESFELCFYKEKKKKNDKREHLLLQAGYCSYHYQTVRLGAEELYIAIKAFLAKDEDEHDVIMLDIVFPSAGFSRLIKLFILEDERIVIECQEYPDMKAIVEQVLYGDAVIAGNTIDLTGKLPESIRIFLDHQVEPKVNGTFSTKES